MESFRPSESPDREIKDPDNNNEIKISPDTVVEQNEMARGAFFEQFPVPGRQRENSFARVTMNGMTFDFNQPDNARRSIRNTPDNPEDENMKVKDWPEAKYISNEQDRFRLELDQKHVDELLRQKHLIVMAKDQKSAEYVAKLRGIETPESGIFSPLMYPEASSEIMPKLTDKKKLELMFLHPQANERLIKLLVDHLYQEGPENAGDNKNFNRMVALIAAFRKAILAMLDPQTEENLFRTTGTKLDDWGNDSAKDVYSRRELILRKIGEEVLLENIRNA